MYNGRPISSITPKEINEVGDVLEDAQANVLSAYLRPLKKHMRGITPEPQIISPINYEQDIREIVTLDKKIKENQEQKDSFEMTRSHVYRLWFQHVIPSRP